MGPIAATALLTLILAFTVGCRPSADDATGARTSATQETKSAPQDSLSNSSRRDLVPNNDPASDPISPYVRRIFQDSRGDLWFGTNGDGVVRYNGDSLKYFSTYSGFGGVAVRGIVEDKEGNVWFGTDGGITKFDGTSFTNFTEKDGLISNGVWAIFIDSKGTLWIGTAQGVSRFDGVTFSPFSLPAPAGVNTEFDQSYKTVSCVMEDRRGHVWFGTRGAGAYRYDGTSFDHFSKSDGLSDNEVSCILEDRRGTIWLSTMFGGVNTFDGTTFTNVTGPEGLGEMEVWNLYEDKSGNIWFPAEHAGLFRYDGKSFVNFHVKQGLDSGAIQCTFQDRDGRIWAGGSLGLYRLEGGAFVKVGQGGPWK